MRVSLGDGRVVTVAGMAKGSRMTSPQLATLLAVITTDAPFEARALHQALEQSAGRSLGRLAIDGDTSPNDSVMALANGDAGGPPISDPNSYEFGAFQEALDSLCGDLAQQVMRDAAANGKGIQVHVRGATNEAEARRAALAVARSTAVRWACARGAPEWGGMLVAVGSCGVELRPDALELRVGSVVVMADGAVSRFEQGALVQAISGPEIELTVDLRAGAAGASVWTCTTLMDG
jgi:glutamate N-acetyltransferase/amino-acid N-acetyltransferase